MRAILATVLLCVICTGGSFTLQQTCHDGGQYETSPLIAWFDRLAGGKGLRRSIADGYVLPGAGAQA